MKINTKIFFLLLVFLFPGANALYASNDNSLSLTVTPPLFQLTVGPGEFWASELKVVNTNSYDLEFYATVMNFEAKGEEGKGSFTPLVEEFDDPEKLTYSLASWIEISDKPIFVRAGESGAVPFSIRVPENAEPGGHYAAILVGTQPESQFAEGPIVRVSSFVSSLLFVRIEGDVTEEGMIRQFSSEKTLYKIPEADFILRFENTGNVHLQPQGDIAIYNMWGKERGKVLVNQKTNFGNVLPKSMRKFEFSWKGEDNVFEIGRYTAVVTLSYGENGKKNISAKTSFWIVPVVPVAAVSGSLLFFIVVVTWLIRRYIRRALALEKARYGIEETEEISTDYNPNIDTLALPLKEGVIDLRSLKASNIPIGQQDVVKDSQRPLTFFGFLKKYKLFFLFLIIIILGSIGFWIYFNEVLVSEREFNVEVKSTAGD